MKELSCRAAASFNNAFQPTFDRATFLLAQKRATGKRR